MTEQPTDSRFGPAVRRFLEVNNIPEPPPMSDLERAEFERKQDEADAKVRELYGPSEWAA